MKKLALLLLATSFSLSLKTNAQEEEKQFGIKFSGFVKSDFFFDSRQTVAAREGHFLLWPAAEKTSFYDDDINAQPNLNFLAVQSRLKGAITGPDAFGAKTSGVIEGDFFAQANDNINLFRLRHAFIKLQWENTELITGQYWNPLFVTGCFPATLSFNTGVPLQSFARNPQIRLTQSMGDLRVVVAALAQRDYASRGPDPADTNSVETAHSSHFLRNAAMPDMHLQLHYGMKDEATGTSFLAGIGGEYKTIVPRLSSTLNGNTYKVDESLSSMAGIAFAKLALKPITLKIQGRYGENIADVLSISGFAVKQEDPVTGERSYTPLTNMTLWGEAHTNGDTFQVGVFGGYLKNLGTKEAMSSEGNAVYGLGTNIRSLLRVSPRVLFISGKYKVGCELEYTSATYGSGHDVHYVPSTTSTVTNTRVLLSAVYSF
jgi:hypothetical protein